MNEQVRNILEQSTTKTSKIEQLLRLGLTRREIADLVVLCSKIFLTCSFIAFYPLLLYH